MWSFVTDTPSAVEMVMLVSCVLMGLSHLLQPAMWVTFFGSLAERGTNGLVTSNFLNSTAGTVIVALHQVWTGPAIVLTLLGWMLLVKSVIGLIFPTIGMRSLRLSRLGDNAFRGAGIALLAVALCCGLALAGF